MIHHQEESPFPALPALPAYNGPDPFFEIHEGLGNLFNVKRESNLKTSSRKYELGEISTKFENGEIATKFENAQIATNIQKIENPFLKGRLHSVQFDEEGWVPLVASSP